MSEKLFKTKLTPFLLLILSREKQFLFYRQARMTTYENTRRPYEDGRPSW